MNAKRRIDPKAKELAIMNAAVTIFAAKGFEGTNVAEIASKAEVSVGTIYRIFKSKEGLANRVYQRALLRYEEFRSDVIAGDFPPRQQFEAIWFTIVSMLKNFPDDFIFAEIQFHALYIDDESRLKRAKLLSRLTEWTAAMRRLGVIKDVSLDIMQAIVVGGLNNLVKRRQDGEIQITDQMLKELSEVCWQALSIEHTGDLSSKG